VEYPITPDQMMTVAAIGAFGAVVVQWLKQYVPETAGHWVNLIALAVCEVVAFAATWIAEGMNAETAFTAAMLGLFGATLATYGYEVLKNVIAATQPE